MAHEIRVEWDGKFQIVYTLENGEKFAFRCEPRAAKLFAASPDLLKSLEKIVSLAQMKGAIDRHVLDQIAGEAAEAIANAI